MKENELNTLLQSKNEINDRIKFYLEKKILILDHVPKEEVKGHLEKADHNLQFVNSTLKNNFNDWVLVGCYYTLYHIALALILNKGYISKSHDATLCVLIKEHYKELDVDDLKLLNNIYLDNEDILFYVQSKQEREKATYSTQILFDKANVKQIVMKTRLFSSKAKEILK